MDRVDFEFEEFLISEAIRAALHRPNLVVRAFQGRSDQTTIIIGQDTGAMEHQRVGKALEHANT